MPKAKSEVKKNSEKGSMGREFTMRIPVGDTFIGGGGRVLIQSMTNVPTYRHEEAVRQIKALEAAGCDIARVAVTDKRDADALPKIIKGIRVPLVADIQFDYRLALASIENGVHKVRFNPGNIGGEERVKMICDAARERGIPLRVGVNSGSIEKDLLEKYGNTAAALSESALRSVRLLESFGFHDIVISVKASSVKKTVAANRYISERSDYPLHIGVTEAGDPSRGTVKSVIGIGALLLDGIGDTVRVSLTGDPVNEIYAARSVLRALDLDKNYVEIISCPTCSRCHIDLAGMVDQIGEMTAKLEVPLKIAVMGCVVNGPGEAKEADLGIAGGLDKSVIFRKGEVLMTVPNEELMARFVEELCKII